MQNSLIPANAVIPSNVFLSPSGNDGNSGLSAMARGMRDFDADKRMSEKRDALIQKAEWLDPQHKCPAWSEHEKREQYSTLTKDD